MEITVKDFPTELKHRVAATGLFRYAHHFYILYSIILIAALILAYYSASFINSTLGAIVVGLFMAFVMGQFGFLGHDIAHGQVFRSEKMRVVGGEFVWGLVLGMSMVWWENDHHTHHNETNRIGHDTQINGQFVFSKAQYERVSHFQKRYLVPIQHWLFIPFSSFMYIAIVFCSFQFVVSSLAKKLKQPRLLLELCLMVAHFACMTGYLVTMLGWWHSAIILLIVHFIGGLSMGLAFAPNHKGERILAEDEAVTFYTQIETTRNIRPSLITDFALGGLGYQIEHHLFPKLPRPLLKKVRPLVKQYCTEQNIPYHETTLLGSYAEIIHVLRTQAGNNQMPG